MSVFEYIKQPSTILIVLFNYATSSQCFDIESSLNNSKHCRENCTVTKQCCSFYYCRDGICRKFGSDIEFIPFAKVSLEITFAILLAAIFVFLMRGLLNSTCGRFQAFQRDENGSSVPASGTRLYSRQLSNHSLPSYEINRDKPPSYEECVRSTPRGANLDLPPPYTVSGNLPSDLVGSEPSLNNLSFNSQNLTPLNAQNLEIALEQGFENGSENAKKPPKLNN